MSEWEELARLIEEAMKIWAEVSNDTDICSFLARSMAVAGYRKVGPDKVVVPREPTEEMNRIWWNNGGPKPPWEQMITAATTGKPKP